MSKRRTDLQGRFPGVVAIDKAVDAGQRWWPIMLTIYAGLGTAYARTGILFSHLGWIDFIAIGFVSSLALTTLTLGLFGIYRQWRQPPTPAIDRKEFCDEVVRLADLVDGQDPIVFDKKFTRCVIVGPGQIRLMHNVTSIYCSISRAEDIVTLKEGADIWGSVAFVNSSLLGCYFDNVAILATAQEAANMRLNLTQASLRDWKERKWK